MWRVATSRPCECRAYRPCRLPLLPCRLPAGGMTRYRACYPQLSWTSAHPVACPGLCRPLAAGSRVGTGRTAWGASITSRIQPICPTQRDRGIARQQVAMATPPAVATQLAGVLPTNMVAPQALVHVLTTALSLARHRRMRCMSNHHMGRWLRRRTWAAPIRHSVHRMTSTGNVGTVATTGLGAAHTPTQGGCSRLMGGSMRQRFTTSGRDTTNTAVQRLHHLQ